MTGTGAGDGCVVVLDLVRAGRRLSTAPAAATVRRVAGRLADRLPSGSRLRDDGPDTVSVVLPGRDRAAASEWMHRVLPGLVDDLDVDGAVAGALLRAAVHDTDGVVGAQILHRLDGVRRPVTGPDRADGTGRRGRDGGAGDDRPIGPAAGRHDESAGRLPYLPDGVVVRPGSGGRRHRSGPEPAPEHVPGPGEAVAAAPRSVAPQSTEGLGLADLLAGALAAYRGI